MFEQGTAQSGAALKMAGIALIVTGALLYAALGDPEENPLALVGVFVMIAGVLLNFRGRRQAAKAIATGPGSPIYDSKPDVLYLRSFRTDTSTPIKILLSGLSTEEEQLADVLRPFGDMIAIGRPGEPLPTPGAVRMYARDSEWKKVVRDRMRSAPLVIIRAGAGPGLLWEVEQALTTLRPEKVLILILDITMKEYRAFSDEVANKFQLVLPKVGPSGLLRAVAEYRYNPSTVLPGFVSFSEDWSPSFHPMPSALVRVGYNDLKKSFNLALRPVFEKHRVVWSPAKRFG